MSADPWFDTIDLFRHSKSAMNSISHFVLKHWYSRFDRILHLGNDKTLKRLRQFSNAVCDKEEVCKVWTFTNGALRQSSHAKRFDGATSAEERVPAQVRVQVPNPPHAGWLIVHIFGPVEGRCHEIVLLR